MIRHLVLGMILYCAFGCTGFHKEIAEHRTKYKTDFLTDPRSPLKEEDLKNLSFYAPDENARVNARFVITPQAEPFDMPTYSGVTRSYRKWGDAIFFWKQDSVMLSIYQNLTLLSNPVYQDYLFLPFKDETNGVSTYGGGRYLNMSKADTEDGWIIIDFNKSYNPRCAYSDDFHCPIPPKENHLSFPIHAGEKQYKGIIKHD